MSPVKVGATSTDSGLCVRRKFRAVGLRFGERTHFCNSVVFSKNAFCNGDEAASSSGL